MKLCPSVTLSCIGVLAAIASWAVVAAPPPGAQTPWPPIATFSILGYDPETGEIGGAVQSRVFAVGNGVLWAEADTRLGPGSSMEVATRVRATR